MSTPSGLIVRDLRNSLRGPYNADIPAGSCTVLSGASGVGKSLFLRMIADLDPSDGLVSVNGIDRNAISAPHWRRLVTYVAAEPGWWAQTVAKHMADSVTAISYMEHMNLAPDLINAPVAQLSTGERQRAALARAIVRRPSFLLLDEPTSALDEKSKLAVEAVLKRLTCNGVGLLVVSHDSAQARRIADRAFVMSHNGLLEVEP